MAERNLIFRLPPFSVKRFGMEENMSVKTEKYDYLIVGAGLYGAVFAREAVKAGKRFW